MNSSIRLFRFATRALLCTAATCLALAARAAERVGIYDSRALAYACFNSPEHLAALRARMTEAKAAKARGDEARYHALAEEMQAEQKRSHLQVFSTAPVPEALAELQPQIAAVQRELGVTRLVSKWDEAALRAVPAADRVDVTEALLRDLPLNEKQRTVLRELLAKEPLPLWKAKALALAGKL